MEKLGHMTGVAVGLMVGMIIVMASIMISTRSIFVQYVMT